MTRLPAALFAVTVAVAGTVTGLPGLASAEVMYAPGDAGGAAIDDGPADPGVFAGGVPTWSVAIGPTWRGPTTTSAVRLTTDTLTGVDVTVARHLLTVPGPGPLPDVALAVELDVATTGADGQTFQSLSSHIDSTWFTAGAHADVAVLWPWLRAGVGAALGTARTSVELVPAGGLAATSDHGWTALAEARARVGITLGRPALRFGGFIEAGYAMTSALEIRAEPADRPDPDLTIPTSHAALGHLDLDGWTLRIGTSIGF